MGHVTGMRSAKIRAIRDDSLLQLLTCPVLDHAQ